MSGIVEDSGQWIVVSEQQMEKERGRDNCSGARRYDESMPISADKRDSLLEGIHVLDGGMASELEHLGARIDGPLWSAHVLEEAPEKIVAVHRAYIAAGADCIETASYQVSRRGYAEIGLAPEPCRCGTSALGGACTRGGRGVSRSPGGNRGVAGALWGGSAQRR